MNNLPAIRGNHAPVPAVPEPAAESTERGRTGEIVAGSLLLSVNGPHGTTAETLPGEREPQPRLRPAEQLGGGRRGSGATLLEREEVCARARELLEQGRSVRLVGPPGSGRSAVLAVSAGPGAVRLSGHHRGPAELLHELFAIAYTTEGPYRPDHARLLELLRPLRLQVVVDDLEFGGAQLDELLAAAPGCAFLLAATPDLPAPAAETVELRLEGLSRAGSLALVSRLAGRSLDESERAWAVDLWFESEGLPLRFVQAAALLRHREHAIDALANGLTEPDEDPVPLPSVAESAAPAERIARGLTEPARKVLEVATAFGGECPAPPHLPALIDVGHAEAALEELTEAGLAVPAGAHHRLIGLPVAPATGVPGAAEHFAWWTGHASVTEQQIADEAEVLLAVMRTDLEAGRHADVVRLVRAAAPSFALAQHWGAWERALRYGLEAAREAQLVAEEAAFHHELGILLLASGSGERARAELDASVALRAALGDARGTANGRGALALVAAATATPAAAPTVPAPRSPLRLLTRRPTEKATRRQITTAVAGVALMGALGGAVAFGVSAFGSPSHGGTVTPTPTPSSVSDDTSTPPPDDSASATASPAPSASGSVSTSASASPSGSSGSTASGPTSSQTSDAPTSTSPASVGPVTPTPTKSTPKASPTRTRTSSPSASPSRSATASPPPSASASPSTSQSSSSTVATSSSP